MQSGQLLNLQRLERFYLQTLSQNGWESPLVVNAAVDFANTLIKDGRLLLKQGNYTQAEMYFNRAKEITTPISITSGIFYTNTFVKSRSHAILQLSQLYEHQGQFQKAWMNLREVLPFMEKFSYTKRVNICEDDKQVLKVYAQLLFHGSDVCRMMHHKDDMLDQCNKLVDILQRLGITFDSLRTLTKEEFHQEYKEFFMMLARAFYQIGKSQFKVGFERESLKNLYKAWQIQELIYGPDASATMKARDKYQKLSQKMEFEMIMGQEKVDFQQFKVALQKEVGQELLRKVVTLKPNKNFDHHMQTHVNSYQQIVRQLSSHSTKYQMPEYVKKVRQEYQEKLKTFSNQIQIEEYQEQQEKAFQLANKKPSSRATSTQLNQSLLPQDKLFSPRMSLATHSHRTSQIMGSQMDKFKVQLQEAQLKAEPIDELMLMRPQFKSEHTQQKKKSDRQGDKTEQIIVKKTKIKSTRFVSRKLNKQTTQIVSSKSDTQQNEFMISKVRTTQDFNKQQQLDEMRVPTTESILAQQQQISQQQVLVPLLLNIQNEIIESGENLYKDQLNKYTINQLNQAAKVIQIYFRRYKCNIKQITTTKTIELTSITTLKPQSQTNCTEKFDSVQVIRSSMKVSVKELQNSIKRGGRFDQIVKELKNNEDEQISTKKAKTLTQIIVDFYNLPQQELQFLCRLFFDNEIKIWKLSNISIFAFSDHGCPNNQKFYDQQTQSFFNIPQLLSNLIYVILEQQLQQIKNIFSDQHSIIALQLIVYFQLQNDSQQYNLNFKINNFISYLDEYQRWFTQDRLENFNGLLSIYCKQQNLYEPNACKTMVFQKNDFATKIVAKLMYALRNHYYLIKSFFGYQLVSMKDAINKQLLDQIIDGTKLEKNKKIYKERKRIMLLKHFKNEPFKSIESQHYQLQTSAFSAQKRLQINTNDEFIHEQSIAIQESECSHDNLSLSNQKQLLVNQKSFQDSCEIDYNRQSAQRNQKKQYTTINNKNYIIGLRSQHATSSQAVIKNNLVQKICSPPIPEFDQRQTKEGCEPPLSQKSREDFNQYNDRSQAEIQLAQEYFPEFQLANLKDYQNYQPKEGPIIKFNSELNMQPYFTATIIQSQVQDYIYEYPDNYFALNLIIKQKNTLVIGQVIIEESKSFLIINYKDGSSTKQKINIDFGMKLPNRQKKLEIINSILMQNEILSKQSLIQELLSYDFRHTMILLDRYVKRINHYDNYIQNELHQQLNAGQLLPLTNSYRLIYSERMAQLAIYENINQILPDDILKLSIATSVQNENYDEDVLEGRSFRNYRSMFNIMRNKFYFKDNDYYLKIEVSFRETKVFDTKLLYLSDQQAQQDLIFLKKSVHELIGQEQIKIKITKYQRNQREIYYRAIYEPQDMEKILHIFNNKKLIGYQIRSQSIIQHRLIGKALQFKRQYISIEERNRDKYSVLDQFLLMYIIDPQQFICSENQRLLKQTIIFYYFKQQLKLTLISSSRLRHFMSTYFHRKTFNFQSRVSNIGKVFVECEVYQFNKFYLDLEDGVHTYFYLQITPQESRTKIFKLVLDLADIISICPQVDLDSGFNDKVLHEILNILTAYLICYRTNTYNGIKIPLSSIISQSKYDLYNTFSDVTNGSNIFEEQQKARSTQPKLSMLLKESVNLQKSSTLMMGVQIENLQLPDEASGILKNTSMLTPVFRGQKFIYKTTKVIYSMYVIITVSYLSLNKFQIGLYIPQTCRNFSCYIQQSDFQQMNPDFLESIFPSCLVMKETIDQFYVNRWKFSEITKIYKLAINHPDEFEDFYSEMKSQIKLIPQQELYKQTQGKQQSIDLSNLNELLGKQNDESNKLIESFSDQSRQNARSSTQPPILLKKQISKQYSIQHSYGSQNKMLLILPNQRSTQHIDKSLFFKQSPQVSNQECRENYYQSNKDLFFNQLLVRKNNLDMISSFEIKIWETLIDKITITKNSQNHFIFNLDSFQGVLRENLYTKVVYLGNEVNALFEVFVENVRKPLDMFKVCVPIRLNESQNFQLYQRITLFEDPKVVNFKLMLRKVLHSYYYDERRNLQNHKIRDFQVDSYEFIQSDIQKCSVYMLNKLKKQLKSNPSTFIVQDVLGDEKCPQLIKVNANYKQFTEFKQYQYVLLKRLIFTMRPTQIYVSIFYQENRKKFHLYFSSMKNCKNVTIKYSLKEIQQCIPSAISLLNLGLHQELGNRIYKGFKNRLLVSTYQQLL